MAGLLDFLQAASNAIAGNVTGPVDLLSAGLRYAGLPIPQNPVGGSQWAKDKGLMRDVPQSASSLAGETLGLLSPLAAARAPQIARGLLAMQEAAPGMMSRGAMAPANQEGAIKVWHGSPHTFDKMSSSAIGTGEGAQAYGHGLYFAENPNIAATYQKNLSNSALEWHGRRIVPKPGSAADVALANLDDAFSRQSTNPFSMAAKSVRQIEAIATDANKPTFRKAEDLLAKWEEHGAKPVPGGSLYEASLRWPNAAREAADPLGPQHFLNYDVGLNKQPKEVKSLINQRLQELGYGKGKGALRAYTIEHGGFADPQGDTLVKMFGATPEESSKWLAARGVPGITYLDQASRSAGVGTRNYVTFDDNLIELLKRNGMPIGAK